VFLPTTTGRIHVRATHGGLPIGFGVFLWIAAGRAAWHRPALAASVAIDLGLLVGTLAGIAVAGGTIPRIIVMAGVELALVVPAVLAARRMEAPVGPDRIRGSRREERRDRRGASWPSR
jgi:hypothetical protein